MLSALRMMEPSSLITSAISFAYLRILLILDFVFGQLRSTSRLYILLRNFVCDKDVMRPNEFMIYGSLVKEYLREYHNIVDS